MTHSQDILKQLDEEQTLEFPAPKVVSLRMESPLDAVVDVAWPYGATFVSMFISYLTASKLWWDREVSRETALKLRWENEQRGIARRFQPKIVVDYLVESVKDTLRRNGNDVDDDAPLDTERAETLIERQAFQAVQELGPGTGQQLQLDLAGGEVPEIGAIKPLPKVRKQAALEPARRRIRRKALIEVPPLSEDDQ